MFGLEEGGKGQKGDGAVDGQESISTIDLYSNHTLKKITCCVRYISFCCKRAFILKQVLHTPRSVGQHFLTLFSSSNFPPNKQNLFPWADTYHLQTM